MVQRFEKTCMYLLQASPFLVEKQLRSKQDSFSIFFCEESLHCSVILLILAPLKIVLPFLLKSN